MPGTRIALFVIARYNAHFSGYNTHDSRATWSDWNTFMRVRFENKDASACALAQAIDEHNRTTLLESKKDSYILPIDDLAVIVNPISEPS